MRAPVLGGGGVYRSVDFSMNVDIYSYLMKGSQLTAEAGRTNWQLSQPCLS